MEPNRITEAMELLASNPGLIGSIGAMLGNSGGGGTSATGEGMPDLSQLIGQLGPLLKVASAMFGEGGGASAAAGISDGAIPGEFSETTEDGKEDPREPEVRGDREDRGESLSRGQATASGSPNGGQQIPLDAIMTMLRSEQAGASSDKRPSSPDGSAQTFAPGKKTVPHFPSDKRLSLLIALKPYLSRERSAAVDTILRFGKIGELLEGLMPARGGGTK